MKRKTYKEIYNLFVREKMVRNFVAVVEEFFKTQPVQVSIPHLIFAMVLSVILAFILGKLYIRYGKALSNRKRFADNFIILTATTTFVITVIKSSLALSLGLVGALSIVRFRAAIKEPEEIVFLFLAIAIGLGLGANQFSVTLISFAIIGVIIWGRHFYYKKESEHNLYLTIGGKTSKALTLKNVVDILRRHCKSVHLKRFDHTGDGIIEASFIVDLESFESLERVKSELHKLSDALAITYIDKEGSG